MSRLRLKISFKDDIRRITLSPEEVNFQSMKNIMAEIFNLDKDSFHVKYFDEDNDLITVGTDYDLTEAINVLSYASDRRGASAALRMYVRMKGDDTDIMQSMLMGSSIMASAYSPYTSPPPSSQHQRSSRLPEINPSVFHSPLPHGLMSPAPSPQQPFQPSPNSANFGFSPELHRESPAHPKPSVAANLPHRGVNFAIPEEPVQPKSVAPKPELVFAKPEPEFPKGREVLARDAFVNNKFNIEKVWVVANVGNSDWPVDCTVQSEDGKYVSPVPAIKKNNESEVTLTILRPSSNGSHRWDCVIKTATGKVILKLSPLRITLKEPVKESKPVDPSHSLNDDQKQNVDHLVNMGFDRDAAITALIESDFNLDDALNLLFDS